tara:strand:+ start:1205 stop:1618 length:414 start_codon:yes stop_codon:yes gene_type:complete
MIKNKIVSEINANTQAEKAILWIDRLATTRVNQGREQLGDADSGYCCLGFGCKIHGIEFDSEDPDSEIFANMIGLRTNSGHFNTKFSNKHGDTADCLVDLNDNIQLSFRRISTVIKSRIGELFTPDVARKIDKHYKK